MQWLRAANPSKGVEMSLRLMMAVGGLLLCAFPASVVAQNGKLPWQKYARLIEEGRQIAPLDVNSAFGDKVDLYSGALSFSATDISIPGNSSLSVALSRKLDIHDRDKYGTGGSRTGLRRLGHRHSQRQWRFRYDLACQSL